MDNIGKIVYNHYCTEKTEQTQHTIQTE